MRILLRPSTMPKQVTEAISSRMPRNLSGTTAAFFMGRIDPAKCQNNTLSSTRNFSFAERTPGPRPATSEYAQRLGPDLRRDDGALSSCGFSHKGKGDKAGKGGKDNAQP